MIDAGAMGRSAAKVESAESVLQELLHLARSHAGGSHDASPFGHVQALAPLAKPVDPKRISFSGKPTFDPSPFLNSENVVGYQQPISLGFCTRAIKPVPKEPAHIPSRKVRDFLELLDSGVRLDLFPSRVVDFGLTCGLFTVLKDEQRDRLVLNARPRNACEEAEASGVRSLGLLMQLHYLDCSQDLQMHTEDLRDFYHCFIVGRERNCLRIRVHPETCLGLSARTPELLEEDCPVPALRTMAMGDTSPVCGPRSVRISDGVWTWHYSSLWRAATPSGSHDGAHDR